MRIPNWLKVVIGLLVIALLMLQPLTRSIILFILPLGSGIDDLIVIAALSIAFIIFVIQWFRDPEFARKIFDWFNQ